MRSALLSTVLIVALAAPGLAASTAANANVSYQFGPGSPPGTLTLGGVTGTLSWSGSNWTMTVAGQTFAKGTYDSGTGVFTVTSMPGLSSCLSSCTATTSALTLTGQLAFTTHGAWVSAVANWANSHPGALQTAGLTVGDIVSAAAKDSPHGAAQANGKAGSQVSGGHGGGGDHGGGHGKP